MKQRFEEHGIPYDDIDTEMLELIDVLNFDLGLKTEFCCYGHTRHEETYVIFDACVTDAQIFEIMDYLIITQGNFGSFKKWYRCNGIIRSPIINWTYETGIKFADSNADQKKSYLSQLAAAFKSKVVPVI